MNTKQNVRFLVFCVGLLVAAWAYAQMAISTDGVTFPDGTVQMTAAAAPGTITEYQIIGITTATATGRVTAPDGEGGTLYGRAAMNKLCSSEYGAGVRAAFTEDPLAPWVLASDISADAWIRPTSIVPILVADGQWVAYDAAVGGFGPPASDPSYASHNLDCVGFTLAGGEGLIRDGLYGNSYTANCALQFPITCSAPIVVGK